MPPAIPSLLPDYYSAHAAAALEAAARKQLEAMPVDEFGDMFNPQRATLTFARHALQFLGCEPLWAQPSGAGVVAQNNVSPQYLFAHGGYLYGNTGSVAWDLGRIDPRTGDVMQVGELTGSRVGNSVRGAAVVRGVPYILSRDGRTLYIARVDMDAMTATNVGAITGSGFGFANSLVSDGYTLWMVSITGLFSIDTATAAASRVNIQTNIQIAPVGGQFARQPAAAAYFNGQIYAFYHPNTGNWRFDPAVGAATRLPVSKFYGCAEALGNFIYAQSGGYLYRVHPETGGDADFFDVGYHRRVLGVGEWWVRNAGSPTALSRYIEDALGMSFEYTLRRSAAGRPIGISVTLRADTPESAVASRTPSVTAQLTKRALPYLVGNQLQIDGVSVITPLSAIEYTTGEILETAHFVDGA